jgi:hypothetical protein
MEWKVHSVVLDLESGWPEESTVCRGKKLNNQKEITPIVLWLGPESNGGLLHILDSISNLVGAAMDYRDSVGMIPNPHIRKCL